MIIVLDLGKTLSKLSVWTREGELVERQTYTNQTVKSGPYQSLDVEGIKAWMVSTLSEFARFKKLESLITVGHGAGLALIKDNELVLPPMDYEAEPPHDLMAAYRLQRDAFAHTGSPALAKGLNLGSQLHWLEALYPDIVKESTFIPWAQYWAWVLSGVASSEMTSLGCHTDLWDPGKGYFSDMAQRRGWAKQFAPIKKAGEVLGALSPEWAKRTGLPPTLKIHCGIHDSNAALIAARQFPEMAVADATVLSTGTWFVAMRTTHETLNLSSFNESQDCLVNVDAFAKAVPSARFMGGREIEILLEDGSAPLETATLLAHLPAVLARGSMILPSFVQGCGPFPALSGRFIHPPEEVHAKQVAVFLYAALMAHTSLELIGAKDCLLIEGRFSQAEVFVRALKSLRPRDKIYITNAHQDVSLGAIFLIEPSVKPAGKLLEAAPLERDLSHYAKQWQQYGRQEMAARLGS